METFSLIYGNRIELSLFPIYVNIPSHFSAIYAINVDYQKYHAHGFLLFYHYHVLNQKANTRRL